MARYQNLSVGKLRAEEVYVGTAGGNQGVEQLTSTLYSATITVGTEAANVINVSIQLVDVNGTALATKAYLPMYLSSDSAGLTIEGSGPDSWAIGTDGILIANGGDSVISGALISEADGDIDINMTHVGADTFYMNLVMPDGRIVTSGAITFDATT